mmetsp:Transcript_15239/g.46006  ORF Transcript_15239/g.46006 Transcript_15239/m.46006 type:complete len:225 (-) Transcript_15239:1662-2336(-)
MVRGALVGTLPTHCGNAPWVQSPTAGSPSIVDYWPLPGAQWAPVAVRGVPTTGVAVGLEAPAASHPHGASPSLTASRASAAACSQPPHCPLLPCTPLLPQHRQPRRDRGQPLALHFHHFHQRLLDNPPASIQEQRLGHRQRASRTTTMMQTNRRGGGRMLRPELQYTTECEAPSTRMQLRMWMQSYEESWHLSSCRPRAGASHITASPPLLMRCMHLALSSAVG